MVFPSSLPRLLLFNFASEFYLLSLIHEMYPSSVFSTVYSIWLCCNFVYLNFQLTLPSSNCPYSLCLFITKTFRKNDLCSLPYLPFVSDFLITWVKFSVPMTSLLLYVRTFVVSVCLTMLSLRHYVLLPEAHVLWFLEYCSLPSCLVIFDPDFSGSLISSVFSSVGLSHGVGS